MEISQFAKIMHQKGALQVIIATDEPLYVFVGSKWQQSTTIKPTAKVINGMLDRCVPAQFKTNLQPGDGAFTFSYAAADGQYLVEVRSAQGKRFITITDKNAQPNSIPPAPAFASSTSPITGSPMNSTSSLNKSGSQISREISKGSVNIVTSTPPAASSSDTPTTSPPSYAPPKLAQGGGNPTSGPSGPPDLLDAAWYHAATGQRVGPISQASMEQCIQSNIVKPETMVWRDGMMDWQMAKVTELEPLFRSQPLGAFHSPSHIPPHTDGDNSSGQGEYAIVPHELKAKGFNWGAFLLAPLWALSHRLWGWAAGTFFPGFIPYVGGLINFVVACVMAGQGYELAWRNRRWRNVEHCLEVQRIWMRWGIGILAVSLTISLFAFFAILLPTFGRRQANAQRASCQSNLKQIALAVFMYSQDYDEKFPPALGGGQPVGWADALVPYLKTDQLFTCPTEGHSSSELSPHDAGYSSYRYNSDLSYYSDYDVNEYNKINDPASCILFAEGSNTDSASNATYSSPFGLNGGIPKAPARHLDGGNYAFMDGHVKWYPSSEMSE
jgi:prepilin-type processing-associated H-X9-DG protein